MKSKIIFSALVFAILIGMACVSAGDIDDFSHSNALESDMSVDDSLSIDDDMSIDESISIEENDGNSNQESMLDGELNIGFDLNELESVASDDVLNIADSSIELEYEDIDERSAMRLKDSLAQSSDEYIIGQSNNDILQEVPENCFTRLATELNPALTTVAYYQFSADYTFQQQYDAPYVFGIPIPAIGRPSVIDGNGHFISGAFQASLFTIIGANGGDVTFRNLTFMSAGYDENMMDCYREQAPGGNGDCKNLIHAIGIVARTVNFYNCNFTLNQCPNYGALYAICYAKVQLVNCTFSQNTAANGAALAVDTSTRTNIIGCNFVNNVANQSGGAICLKVDFMELVAE